MPPTQRIGQTSHTVASNPIPATFEEWEPAPIPKTRQCHRTRFANPPCSIMTPFGVPVEPEV